MDAVSVLALGVAAKGGKGEKGDKGDPGVSMTVGTTTTGEAGTQASVTNTGTTSDPILNFTIPKGDKGDKGDTGEQGIQGPKGDTGSQGPKGDTGETGPKGDKGDTGLTGPQGPAGRDGAIQYTAGTNITISADNVISATGGGGISFETGDGLKLEDDVLSLDEAYVTENVVAQGAYQLMSNDGQLVEGEFISRTTGGSASINSGDATHIYFRGNSVNSTATSASAVIKDQTEETKATLNSDTFIAKAVEDGKADGEYEFTADDADYGVLLNGDASVTIAFANANLGTIVNATPTSFTSIGFNAYDHANTRAYVIEGNRYQVFGTYTSIAGQTIEINKEVGSYIIPYSFVATTTGYVNVEGGNDTDTMIALVWSGYNYDHEYEAYTEDTIAISGLPEYGMPRVNGVYDEIDFSRQKYVHRIGRDVVANKDNYSNKIYDSTYVYYVLDVQTESAITIDEKYLADDFGTELFTGTTVPVGVVVIYGANLKDKLRTDVLTKSAQTLSDDEKNQVNANIGLPYIVKKDTIIVKPIASYYYSNQKYSSTSGSTGTDLFNVDDYKVGDILKMIFSKYSSYDEPAVNSIDCKVTAVGKSYIYFEPVNADFKRYDCQLLISGSCSLSFKNVELFNDNSWFNISISAKLPAYENKLPTAAIEDGAIYYKSSKEIATKDNFETSTGCAISIGPNKIYGVDTSTPKFAFGRNNSLGESNSSMFAFGYRNTFDSNGSGVVVGSDNKISDRESIVLGNSNYVSGRTSITIGNNNWKYGGGRDSNYSAIVGWGNDEVAPFQSNFGCYSKYGTERYKGRSVSTTAYNKGDIVSTDNGHLAFCLQDGALGSQIGYSSNEYWELIVIPNQLLKDEKFPLLCIGNGTYDASTYQWTKSNALVLDWAGNITCNNIPACPTDDGTYNLQVSIVDGVPTYSWVSVA